MEILGNFPQREEFDIKGVINVEILRAGYKWLNNLLIQLSELETKYLKFKISVFSE